MEFTISITKEGSLEIILSNEKDLNSVNYQEKGRE